jgi:TorA maturation chaperone TorD
MRSQGHQGAPEALPEEAYLALSRSILYEALAIGFRRPTEQSLVRLAGAGSCAALADAAAECGGAALVDRVADLAAAAGEDPATLAVRHRRLFGHTARGKVTPYETEYGDKDMFQQPQELADLAGFLHAFGLEIRADQHERVDHVSCECEFLSFLARKEAYALEVGDVAMSEETIKAGRLFLRDHLARFTPAFARALDREDRGALYGALGALLLALVDRECSRLGVSLGPASLELRIETDDKLPMACGEAGDCLLADKCNAAIGRAHPDEIPGSRSVSFRTSAPDG